MSDTMMQYGWICPVCGRGLSPFTSVCPCGDTKELITSNVVQPKIITAYPDWKYVDHTSTTKGGNT